MSREPALHTSPWLKKMPQAAAVAAASRSGASAMMMFGLLPPHSSDTRFMLDSPEYFRKYLPTSVEPVKAMQSTSMWRPRAWPAVSPKPGTRSEGRRVGKEGGRQGRYGGGASY